ncbi:MAG: SH3 domain-containing protein [Clostridia bacterium]|nr:SH3 domain-containing protein [Clostridia bacterium]
MKIISIEKKSILKFMIIVTFVFSVFKVSTSFGMQHYYNVDFSTGLVTASQLNVRSGPGTQYKVIATVNKNEYIRVFAGVGDWYIVQVEGDFVGAVSKKYVKAIYPNSSGSSSSSGSNSNSGGSSSSNTGSNQTSTMNADEKEVFELINKQRTNNGLSALQVDSEVQRVARIKAEDMVANNYFSHTSPTYGSPFDMLSSFKVSYRTAGENIAGNSSNSGAVTAWMNSSGHKANILNSNFKYTGIGVVSSNKYGKIYVQMFIGK